jgi:hypothetical protein
MVANNGFCGVGIAFNSKIGGLFDFFAHFRLKNS